MAEEREDPPSSEGDPEPGSATPLAVDPDGLDILEREILELLNAPPVDAVDLLPAPGGPSAPSVTPTAVLPEAAREDLLRPVPLEVLDGGASPVTPPAVAAGPETTAPAVALTLPTPSEVRRESLVPGPSDVSPSPGPQGPRPRPPFGDLAATAGPPAASPSLPGEGGRAYERQLESEILHLRAALETIRSEIAQHGNAVANVHGQLERVHSVLNELRESGTRRTDLSGGITPPRDGPATAPALPAPSPELPPDAEEASDRSRPLSAAPVFFMDPQGKTVAAQAFFTLGKGGALERFLTDVLLDWEGSGYPIEAKAGKDGFTLRLQGDPEGRGLRLLPSGMYLLRLGEKEMARLQRLPPLVSSKVWPKSGGFMRRS